MSDNVEQRLETDIHTYIHTALVHCTDIAADRWHRSAAILVHWTKAVYAVKKLPMRMGYFVARNMQSRLKCITKMINKLTLLHLVGCLRRYSIHSYYKTNEEH